MDRHRVRNRCKLRCAWTEWLLLARRVSSQPNINSVAIGGEADMSRLPASYQSDATDPNVWSGRALQEDFFELAGCAVLHQCIRPLIGAFCAPGHHGYQRACDLISGQASMGHWGHQCSHAPGRPILHLVFILSQTSAGKRLRRLVLNDHAARILLASKVLP